MDRVGTQVAEWPVLPPLAGRSHPGDPFLVAPGTRLRWLEVPAVSNVRLIRVPASISPRTSVPACPGCTERRCVPLQLSHAVAHSSVTVTSKVRSHTVVRLSGSSSLTRRSLAVDSASRGEKRASQNWDAPAVVQGDVADAVDGDRPARQQPWLHVEHRCGVDLVLHLVGPPQLHVDAIATGKQGQCHDIADELRWTVGGADADSVVERPRASTSGCALAGR